MFWGGLAGVAMAVALPFLLVMSVGLMFTAPASHSITVLVVFGLLVRWLWRRANRRTIEVPLSVLAPSLVRDEQDAPEDVKAAREGRPTSLD